MLDAQVSGQFLLQLAMHGAAVGQLFVGPDLLKIRNKLLKLWQQGLGHKDGAFTHAGFQGGYGANLTEGHGGATVAPGSTVIG